MKITGKCSWFGGPDDEGVAPDEGLAFIFDVEDAPHLFLPQQPPGTTGLARRLDPEKYYVAVRWDYDAPHTSKADLLKYKARVRVPNDTLPGHVGYHSFVAYPADWGPNSNTGRVADISPALMTALGITTDDVIEVTYPFGGEEEEDMAIHRVVISAGHGKNCPGAEGLEFNEEDETPRVMHRVAEELRRRGVTVTEFWDQESTNVSDNLSAIVNFHNAQTRDLDVSCHFNSSDGNGHGVEVLHLTQEALAAQVSAAIAANGLTDRGAKYRDDLAFLNGTTAPAILIETCFSDNRGDVDVYAAKFGAICASIATAISGVAGTERPPRPERPERPARPPRPTPRPVVSVTIDVPANIELEVVVNGEALLT